ncbi:MAG: AIR synthase-related protein [Agriterribacter sp.]
MSTRSGKITHHTFETFIAHHSGFRRNEVTAGPAFGVDVSIVALPGNMSMALTSDPLSLVPSLGLAESAWLSVHLMANDMATTGFAPKYGQFVLNLPSTFSKDDFKIYWNHIHQYCADIGVAITGGHTGFVEGQNSTIAGGGTFVTVAPTRKLLVSKNALAGNAILLTKSCAISSAAILAMSFPETVKNRAGSAIYNQACESFYQTTSLKDGLIAAGDNEKLQAVTAMHDVTEGGVLGAVYELAIASGNGAIVYNDALPINEVQATVCNIFDLDPRYCIGAGAMLIACKSEYAEQVTTSLQQKNIPCTKIGVLCNHSKGINLVEDGRQVSITYGEADPYWAAFFKAHQSGWK